MISKQNVESGKPEHSGVCYWSWLTKEYLDIQVDVYVHTQFVL